MDGIMQPLALTLRLSSLGTVQKLGLERKRKD